MTTHNIVGRGGLEVGRVGAERADEIYFKSKQDVTWFILKWS
jgi:hypothetical protein